MIPVTYEANNAGRAHHAYAALVAYAGNDIYDRETSLVDLLGGLRHFAADTGIDFDHCNYMAGRHYDTEVLSEAEPEGRYQNFYFCEDCDIEWDSEWSCMVDDECPGCHKDYTPVRSEDLNEEE